MEKKRKGTAFLLVMAGCGGMLFDFGGTIINRRFPTSNPFGVTRRPSCRT